jgi:divalent metal cation (Fe/Co/Zn/Cd) transporter
MGRFGGTALGALGLGLNVLADVAGSIGLVWRFRVERRDPDVGLRAEALASVVVASVLILMAITLTIAAVNDLIAHSTPEHSVQAVVSAGVPAAVLAPLGWAKYRTGKSLGSHALMGDGTLSAMGAALGVLALIGLLAVGLPQSDGHPPCGACAPERMSGCQYRRL